MAQAFGNTSSLKPLWSWWLGEFQSLFPRAFLDYLNGRRKLSLMLSPGLDGVLMQIVGSSGKIIQEQAVAWAAYDADSLSAFLRRRKGASQLPKVLLLPAASFYVHSFLVPRIAASRLAELARNEIEWHTPFGGGTVLSAAAIEDTPVHADTLRVRQVIVLKQLVEEALSRLHLAESELAFVEMDGPVASVPVRIPLHARPAEGSGWIRRLSHGLLLAIPLLSLAWFGTLWYRQSILIDDLSQKMPAAEARAASVRNLIDDVRKGQASAQALLDQRNVPRGLHIWAELTAILPDDSWLTELRLEEGRLSISGFSANAAGLVGLVGKSTLFKDVTLTAPITTDAITGRERFSLTAAIATAHR